MINCLPYYIINLDNGARVVENESVSVDQSVYTVSFEHSLTQYGSDIAGSCADSVVLE